MKPAFKSFGLPILIMLLAGCAAKPRYEWAHSSADSVQFERDRAQCEYEAEVATPQANYNYLTMFGQEFDNLMRKDKLKTLCMKAKGYYQRPI